MDPSVRLPKSSTKNMPPFPGAMFRSLDFHQLLLFPSMLVVVLVLVNLAGDLFLLLLDLSLFLRCQLATVGSDVVVPFGVDL